MVPRDLRRDRSGGAAARPELPLHYRHDEPGGLEWTTASSNDSLPPGRHTVLYDFAYSGDEGIDVSVDKETQVTPEYGIDNAFTGTIQKVTFQVK